MSEAAARWVACAPVAVVLALLSSILWGTADFGGGLITRRLPALVVVGCSQAAGLVGVAVLALSVQEQGAPSRWLAWSVLAGVSGASGLACFYRALATGTMGVVSPVAALGVAVPVVAGLVSGERPGALQLVGIVVAMAGAIAASGPELTGGSEPTDGLGGSTARGRTATTTHTARTSVALAVLSGALFGLCQLAIARGAQESTLLTLVGMRGTSVALFCVVLIVGGVGLGGRGLRGIGALRRTVSRRDVPALAAIGLADVGANLLFGVASTMGLVSIVAVLGTLYPVATVVLARLVLGERLHPLQLAGVATTLAGVALLALG